MTSAPPPVEYQYDVPPDNREQLIPRTYIIIGVVVALVLGVLFILGLVWLAQTQAMTIEAVRDIMIIALALESCVFGIVLMLLLIMVIRLVNMLEFEIKPVLQKTNETLGTVQGTTTFVTENVVRPVTKASSYMAGARRGLQTLFGDPKKNLPR